MKKLAALILLIALVCVGCAEKQEDPAIVETVTGKWLYADTASGPVWIELLPDGVCNLSSGVQYSWKGTARQPDGTCTVALLSGRETVYNMHILEDSALLTDPQSTSAGSYTRVVHGPEEETGNWFAAWYPTRSGTEGTLTLSAGGICTVGGKAYEWTSVEWSEEKAKLLCFDDTGMIGWLQLSKLPGGFSYLIFTDESGVVLQEYCSEQLIITLLGTWQPFREEGFPLQFQLQTVTAGDVEYPWQLVAAENNVLTVSLSADGQAYTARIWMEGAYPRMELAAEERVLYYRTDRGHDPNDPEARYRALMSDLAEYTQKGGYAALSGNAALADLYARLQDLSGYQDVDSYLSRFTVVEDKLIRVVEISKDAAGRTSENILELYSYDAAGRLISGRGKTLEEAYGISNHITVGTMYFTYDDNGTVTSIRVGTEDTTAAICTPSYNTKGNLSLMHIAAEDLTITVSFTYNSKNLRSSYRIPYSALDEEYYGYTYDNQGQCTKKTGKWAVYGYTETTTYTYSDTGALQEEKVVKTIVYPEMTRTTTTCYTYTCDPEGRPLHAAVTTDDPAVTYAEQQLQYIYEDVYFYDPA